MRITNIRCYVVADEHPPFPFRWRKGLPGSGDGTSLSEKPKAAILRMDTDEGISGWGEAYNHGPDRALPPVLEYLYPQIEGIDPRRIEFIYHKLLQSSRFPPGAIGLAAISAVEHALWDISKWSSQR